MSRPLDGVVVLDLSRVLAGPWAGQQLADLGARVIKIEHPTRGDDTRGWGPPWLDGDHGAERQAAYYLCANRGKQSLAVDISIEGGQALVRELAKGADILLENFKVGGLAKYGLDYSSLKALNPGLIGCSITGFGQGGPYAHRAGYDFMIQAMGGLMSLTGEPNGMPMKTGVAITDVMTGLYATVGVLAALHERERTGRGRHIDVALLDVQVATLANQALNALTSGASPQRHGNAHPNIVPYQAFACADGHLVLTVGNDAQFSRLATLLGHPEWAEDPAYATNAARVDNREVLVTMIQTRLLGRERDAWLAELEVRGIPAGPINTLTEVFDDPQVRHRGMARQIDGVPQVANPLRFDGEALTSDVAPPRLGQDSDAILAEMGLTTEDIARLRREGVIR
ncbi:CaiB/BaiF CoA transferase family protein [Halomonas saccharevitans]|uniref:Crotonobetainyl-CoA:carnitine CoA-transferase CaiB n=1 Tax=Halomonas saccharevitans TaxID=416872 RepID=A0A1I7BQN3_9GAMM|nr:CaiB/BaiF CoA-transferase family protein [Halomonas saccharevitans]SFT89487.1 Crotonobetainyl-CoA:carnitine CoA-transferase CaiB [Halomonas saccharevitans]